MKIFGIAGWSGSGKTTLTVRLIPMLVRRGLTVSTMKHAHHTFDVDKPGKDSYEHRMAGATEVMLTSGHRWALMHELRGADEPNIGQLLGHMSTVDLVLVEGFKRHEHHKLEVHRPALAKPLLFPKDPNIVAIASDAPLEDSGGLPVLGLDDVDAIAAFIVTHCGLGAVAQAAS